MIPAAARRQDPVALDWTGYIYGGLAHSVHIRYGPDAEKTGEGSVRRMLRRAGLAAEDMAGCRVLDVGAGWSALGFRRLGAIVEHHDISAPTVAALNDYVDACGYSGIRSFRTDLVHDPLPAGCFDLVYLAGVLQHFADPGRALANVARALKRGGCLYVDIYRSGRWRWFVVDILRQIARPSLLYPVLERFTEMCAAARLRSFDLRQTELLIDDLFVDNLLLFHPDDVLAAAAALGLEAVKPVTSMDLIDSGPPVDHSLFFGHVFNTFVLRRGDGESQAPAAVEMSPRRQLEEVRSCPAAYRDVARLTAEFVLAHQAGRFSREQTVSHLVNLYRMAHPCLPADPYQVCGTREAAGSRVVAGDDAVLARRHDLWCTFLAHVLGVRNPLNEFAMPSLGYELVRLLGPDAGPAAEPRAPAGPPGCPK